jgi:hypothetical protein
MAVWLSVGLGPACGVGVDPSAQVDEPVDVIWDGDAAASTPGAPLPSSLRQLAQRAQRAYVKASNTGAYDYFGTSIALSADGSTLAVGALGEDSAGGDQADESLVQSGAVYVFQRRGKTWIQQAYLKAGNAGSGDFFGTSVALSADGSTLAVAAPWEASAATGIDGDETDDSAPGAGAVYVFQRRGKTWSQEAYLKASNTDADDNFGFDISLSADGSTLAVGVPWEDSAATGVGGDQADDSAGNAAAYDFFGYTVALSSDGSTLAASATAEDSAAIGVGGDPADDSAMDAGAVYVLARTGATSATFAGAVYVFDRRQQGGPHAVP